MSTIPDTNSGTVAAERPVTEMTRSGTRPTLSAAKTPPMMPSGTTMMKASPPSLAELTSVQKRAKSDRPSSRRERERRAHAAVQQPANPAEVLREEGPVHAELVVEDAHRTRGGQRAEYREAGTPREHL